MPSVLLKSWMPMNRLRSHLPDFSDSLASGIFRAAASMIPRVSSVAASVLPVGAFMTMMPFLLAASMSILSRPTPARPIIFNFPGFSRRSAVTAVPLRVMIASYSPMILASSGFFMPGLTWASTVPSRVRISRPSGRNVIRHKYLKGLHRYTCLCRKVCCAVH